MPRVHRLVAGLFLMDAVMNVTVVTSYPLSEPVIKNRLEPLMRSLLDDGYIVYLVSPKGGVLSEDLARQVKHVGISCPSSIGAGFFMRAINEARLAIKLFKVVAKLNSYGIIVTIPSMFLLFLFRGNAGRKVLDVRDLTWEYLSEKNLSSKVAKRIFRFIARFKIRKFDVVSATNDTELNYLKRGVGVDSNKLVGLPNGISINQYKLLVSQPLVKKAATRLKVCYVGNVGLAQDLTTLLSVAQIMQGYDFVIVGEGTDYLRVRGICAEKMLSNVLFTGRIPWDRIPEIYAAADILYAQLLPEYAGAMPSKIYEYLATGKFLIFGGQGQAAQTLQSFENNIVIPPGDVDALCNALKRVAKEGRWRDLSMSNRSRIYQNFIREKNSVNLVRRLAED